MGTSEYLFVFEIDAEIQTICRNKGEGWEELNEQKQAVEDFFELLEANVLALEFWSPDPEDVQWRIEGYEFNIQFRATASHVHDFAAAVRLFFDFHHIKKTDERLKIIEIQ